MSHMGLDGPLWIAQGALAGTVRSLSSCALAGLGV
jgi:hypothetical protein